MKIVIDGREQDLLKKCLAFAQIQKGAQELEITSAALPLGDIILYHENVEVVIFERKSLQDLASSIRDGRYQEQSFRLDACDQPNHQIIYVVEGDLRFYRPFKGNNIDKFALLSSMVSVNYFKGFSVHRTLNLDETAEYILQYAVKLQKELSKKKRGYYAAAAAQDANVGSAAAAAQDANGCGAAAATQDANDGCGPYSSLVKRVKRANITTDNIGEIMLAQIPGVSHAAACAIMAKYKTMKAMLAAMETDANALQDIMANNRRLNRPCIANIYAYLLISSK